MPPPPQPSPLLQLPPEFTPALVAYMLEHIDDTQGPRVVAISVLFIVTSVVAVVLRFIARKMRKLPWLIDDWFMLPALFFTVMLCVENIICVHFGDGKHLLALTVPNIVKIGQGIYYLSVTYGFVHFFIKMSILLLYRRLFSDINRAFAIGLRATMVYVTAWSVATVLVCIFACTPISFFWTQLLPNPPPGVCIDEVAAQVGLNVLNTVGDIATLLLPGLALWGLRMTTERKVAVAAIFMIGLFAVGAGIARTVMVYREGLDFTYDDADLVVWTAIEPAVGILCACFPVIAPAFNRSMFKGRLGSGSGSFLRRVFGSKTSKKGASDDSMPLSFISPYVSANEKTTHPFSHLRESEDKESQVVVESDISRHNSAVVTRQVFVPEYEADGALPALPHETVRSGSDAEWVAKYPHRQV